MFLVSTRNFPPELGGMQNLMEGLSNALLNHGPVKVFADNHEHADTYDQNSKLNIERISGFKIFRKYRKANLVKDFKGIIVGYACIIDRSDGKSAIDGKIVSQLELNIPTYSKDNLPDNLSSIKAIKPGSRDL